MLAVSRTSPRSSGDGVRGRSKLWVRERRVFAAFFRRQPMSGPEILSVASEIFPLIKTGGLADVAGALPLALAREGVSVTTLIPGYPTVMAALEQTQEVHRFAS